MNKSNIIFAVVGVIVGLLLSTMFSSPLGGVYNNVTNDFSEGISVDGTTIIDGSGNVSAATLSASGAVSLTDTLGVTEATGTSTITVKATAASTGGRIILEDSDGAGCSEIYILNGTVISATVTCP